MEKAYLVLNSKLVEIWMLTTLLLRTKKEVSSMTKKYISP